MHSVSYSRHRFPADVIQHAVWLYFRFPLSSRDVGNLLAQRSIDVSYETVRRWSVKFGLGSVRQLRNPRRISLAIKRLNDNCVRRALDATADDGQRFKCCS